MNQLTQKYARCERREFVLTYDQLSFEEKQIVDLMVARLKSQVAKMRDIDALELIGKLGIYMLSKGVIEK